MFNDSAPCGRFGVFLDHDSYFVYTAHAHLPNEQIGTLRQLLFLDNNEEPMLIFMLNDDICGQE